MLKFIIRLDDACENMNEKKWNRIEKLLDKYNIKPIVGIIPENKDLSFTNNIKDFWGKYPIKWQEKKWIIAQHGLNHNLDKNIRTEFSEKTYEEQIKILDKGYKILKNNKITPECFFAPNHTFDKNTIKACKNLNYYKYISDGYALFPYTYKNMIFLPSIFDTPHKILPFGIYTFVYHPNNMDDSDFEYLENFIKKNCENFIIDIDEIIKKYSRRKKNILDYFLQFLIYIYRKVRGNDTK